jgi:hypothetical protein
VDGVSGMCWVHGCNASSLGQLPLGVASSLYCGIEPKFNMLAKYLNMVGMLLMQVWPIVHISARIYFVAPFPMLMYKVIGDGTFT